MGHRTSWNHRIIWIGRIALFALIGVMVAALTACDSSPSAAMAEDEPVAAREVTYYTPLERDDWETSTPEAEGLDPDLLDDLYRDADRIDRLFSVLVIKNGKLVAEQYFNEGAVDQESMIASVVKSYVSALVGLSLAEGCLTGLDQKLLDFYPEQARQVEDPRKFDVTLEHLLTMRSGYPWEETHPDLFEAMWVGDNPPLVVAFPLTADPGAVFQYSNTTPSWLADIAARSCESDLKTFMETHLLEPIGSGHGEMYPNDYDDYHAVLNFSARDMAKFGLLYLNRGEWDGEQVIPAEWVDASLQTYTEDAWDRIGRNFHDMGYGYMWWSATAGKHDFNFAWGHGGQLIVLLHDLDMVIVTKADPFWQQHDGESWRNEKATLNMVGDFIASLPVE